MKVCVTMKCPDAVDEAIEEAVHFALLNQNIPQTEREALEEEQIPLVQARLRKWVQHGEYVRIEFDTDAGTATVLPAKG